MTLSNDLKFCDSRRQAITSFRNVLYFSINEVSVSHSLVWKQKIWSSFTYCTSCCWYETD